MVCILEHLQRYVPTARQETKHQITSTEEETICLERFHRVLLGGDQLTVARVRSCQRGRANSDSAVNRFNGLLPIAEDWHTGVTVILLTVSIKSMLIYMYRFYLLWWVPTQTLCFLSIPANTTS